MKKIFSGEQDKSSGTREGARAHNDSVNRIPGVGRESRKEPSLGGKSSPTDPTVNQTFRSSPAPLKRGVPEPDLEHDDFKPRLTTRILRERGGILGRLKRTAKVSNRVTKRPASRMKDSVRGRLHGVREYPQRVVVKARVVSGRGASSLERMRKHRSYLTRSGTGLTGSRPEFFDAGGRRTQDELHQSGTSWVSDPHHFRFIISPEQGAKLELEDYVRTVMASVEADLKTRLEWYGVCHHNTDNAHAHVVLRGVDDTGEPLVISREYLSHGVRHVAEREASVRLGMRGPEEVSRDIGQMLSAERFTFIDRELVKEQERSRAAEVSIEPLGPDSREFIKKARLHKLQRLAFLESKGLSREVRAGVWKVDANLEGVLRELAQRRTVEKLVAPYLANREEAKQDLHIHKESEQFGPQELVGTVLAKALLDELHDKRFLLLSGADGRNHFIPLGAFSEVAGFECQVGQVVRVVEQKPTLVRAEEVILRYLGEKGGEFLVDRFRGHVGTEVVNGRWELPSGVTVDEYVERFVARCESLHKAGLIEALGQGGWKIPSDVVQKARTFDATVNKKLKVSVEPESFRLLSDETRTRGASWLDRIVTENRSIRRSMGTFGRELTRALKARRDLLQERGISFNSKDTYHELLKKEEQEMLARVSKQHRRGAQTLVEGTQVRGTVVGYELLGDGYRMVVGADDGSFVARRVGRREARVQVGEQVTLSVLRRDSSGRLRINIALQEKQRERERKQTTKSRVSKV
jgi:type IV secretory pathway VirD2 relaxase